MPIDRTNIRWKVRAERPERELFLSYIAVDALTGCWIWKGAPNKAGYGTFRLHGKRRIASRAAVEIFTGAISDGLFVCHRCDNRRCANPDHLFVGTQKDNMSDASNKGRMVNVGPRPGQFAGEKSNSAKLTIAQVVEIRASKLPSRALAPIYGVHHSTITSARSGVTWRTVADSNNSAAAEPIRDWAKAQKEEGAS